MISVAKCSKGQMKIQEMAFVLVAMMIFFGLVALIFSSINLNKLSKQSEGLRENDARELVRKISGTPELSFTATTCSNCIDIDKALVLKNQKAYYGFFNLDYMMIERVYPSKKGECTIGNFPDCGRITIINSSGFLSAPYSYVSLCRYEGSIDKGYYKCELGRIHAAGKGLE
jgi:hypothetical protein